MIKGINLFRKDYIIYYIGSIVLAFIVGCSDGLEHLLQYISILVTLFVPSVIILQLIIFVKQLIHKEHLKLLEIISFIVCLMILISAYMFGLAEKQQLFMLISNIFIISVMIIVFFILVIKNRR